MLELIVIVNENEINIGNPMLRYKLEKDSKGWAFKCLQKICK